MLRNEVKANSGRKPLKDLSNKNCGRSSKSANLNKMAVSQKHNKEDTPKVVEDDNVLDQLLLVQSDLSSLAQQISDFGLAKLVGKTNDGEITVTEVVGTYGYIAPEYLSDGLATTKTDVYAFGVVLFEIITGREAIIQTEGTMTKNPERRSLASIMLAALRNSPDSMSMSSLRYYIDPNMMDLYPHDCVFKMAILAEQCVDDDHILRPDMKQVVISLSQILLSSVEWEATLAGNSQVFSGLVQGR